MLTASAGAYPPAQVRVYNLAKQELAKKLVAGGGLVTCAALHPGGDHVIVGSADTRLAWFDLDLSTKPYKALRYHKCAATARAEPRLLRRCAPHGACHNSISALCTSHLQALVQPDPC